MWKIAKDQKAWSLFFQGPYTQLFEEEHEPEHGKGDQVCPWKPWRGAICISLSDRLAIQLQGVQLTVALWDSTSALEQRCCCSPPMTEHGWGYFNLATPTQHRTPCWAACPGAHCCFSDLHCSLRLFLPTPASSSLSLIMSHINKPFKFSALAPTPQRTQLTYCLTAYFISGIWQGLGHSRAPPIFVE